MTGDCIPEYEYVCQGKSKHWQASNNPLKRCLLAPCSKPLTRIGKGSRKPRRRSTSEITEQLARVAERSTSVDRTEVPA